MHTRSLGLGLPAVVVLAVAIAMVAFPFVPEPAPVMAANLEVTTLADTDDSVCDANCSLRDAITVANANVEADTITFADGLTGTITLGSPLPSLSDGITISGPGPDLLTVDADGTGRVLTVPLRTKC